MVEMFLILYYNTDIHIIIHLEIKRQIKNF